MNRKASLHSASRGLAAVLGGVFVLLSIAPRLCGADAPFLVLEDTASPNGAYAFAWGGRGGDAKLFQALREGREEVLESADFADGVENYLVDLNKGSVLVRLSSAQAWTLPSGAGGNHRGLTVAWSPQSDAAVAIFSLKWGFESLTVFWLEDGGVARSAEIGEKVEKAFREHLSKTFGKRYLTRAENLVVGFGSLVAEEGEERTFRVQAHAEVPKSDDDDDLFEEQTIRFTVDANGLRSIQVIGN